MNDTSRNGKVSVFFAYAREDRALMKRIDTHLSPLKRMEYISTWDDGEINAGADWEVEINYQLTRSDIILLLISADFIASDYCYNNEMEKALARDHNGDAVVIPIILSHCTWEKTKFAKLQALPENGTPITDKSWPDREEVLRNVANSIGHIVVNLLNERKKKLLSLAELIEEKEFEIMLKEDKLNELNTAIESLNLDAEEVEEEISKRLSERDNIIEEINGLTEQRDELLLIISKNQKEINRSRSLIEQLQQEENKLKADIEKYSTKLENVKADFKRTTKEAYKQD